MAVPIEALPGRHGRRARRAGRAQHDAAAEERRQHGHQQLTSGATLFLPVLVHGRAVQRRRRPRRPGRRRGLHHRGRDECPVSRCASVSRRGQAVPEPQLRTRRPPAGEGRRGPCYATTANGPDLFASSQQTIRYMIDHIVRERGLSREQAYVVCWSPSTSRSARSWTRRTGSCRRSCPSRSSSEHRRRSDRAAARLAARLAGARARRGLRGRPEDVRARDRRLRHGHPHGGRHRARHGCAVAQGVGQHPGVHGARRPGPGRDHRRPGVGGHHVGLARRQAGRVHVPPSRPLHRRPRAARRPLAGHPHALLASFLNQRRRSPCTSASASSPPTTRSASTSWPARPRTRGFESLFVPEHTHIPTSRRSPFAGGATLPEEYKHTLDPFVSLMAAAAVTKKLKVGTGICLIIERDTDHHRQVGGQPRPAVERPLRSRHRRRLERGGDGAPRHDLQVPLPAPARAGAGHEGAVDQGRGRVPAASSCASSRLVVAQAGAEAAPADSAGRREHAYAQARGRVLRRLVPARPQRRSRAHRDSPI